MRKIVVITQVVDRDDANLGATVAKIAALARRLDEVVVLCDRGFEDSLPANCRIRVFGARTRPQRAWRFASALLAELRDPPVAVLGHMVPLYTVAAAPFVRLRRVPLMLWYTHWKGHAVVRLAMLACTHLLSLDRRSFPFDSPKLHGIGHGIDLAEFPCQEKVPTEGRLFRVVSLGRYSPLKRLDELIEGVRIARASGLDVRIDLYGTDWAETEAAHKRELEHLVSRADYREFATVRGPIPRTRLAEIFREADVVASAFISPDKIVLEACASCRPVLATHESFDELFAGVQPSLAFERGRPETFANRLRALAALDDEARRTIGKTLRDRVRARHSVDTWANAILALASRS